VKSSNEYMSYTAGDTKPLNSTYIIYSN